MKLKNTEKFKVTGYKKMYQANTESKESSDIVL